MNRHHVSWNRRLPGITSRPQWLKTGLFLALMPGDIPGGQPRLRPRKGQPSHSRQSQWAGLVPVSLSVSPRPALGPATSLLRRALTYQSTTCDSGRFLLKPDFWSVHVSLSTHLKQPRKPQILSVDSPTNFPRARCWFSERINSIFSCREPHPQLSSGPSEDR